MGKNITESTIVAYLNGELTSEEEKAVRDWLRLNKENQRQFEEIQNDILRARWGTRASLIEGCPDLSTSFRRRRAKIRRIVAAAVLIPAVTLVSALFIFSDTSLKNSDRISQISPPQNQIILQLSDGTQHIVDTDTDSHLMEKDGTQIVISGGEVVYDKERRSGNEVVYNKVSVPRGANPYRAVLGDGSVVWLNSDSQLEYPLHFVGEERRVILTGEAYFEVTRDERKAFIVESGGQSVTVLGTEFNISGYSGETIVTTLISGKVRVTPGNADESVILSPGQQTSYNTITGDIQLTEVKVSDFMSWKDGVLSIEKMSLTDVLTKVSRTYNVVFDTTDSEIEDIVLRGRIPTKVSFETVLSILKKTANVEFKIKRNGEIKVVNS